MKLVEIDWHPTNRQLRQFGGLCLFALPGIAWLWGGTTTVIATLCVFFGVFLPIGLAFRLMGRDALQLKMARDTTTYWRSKPKPPHAGSYYRQT